MLKPTIDVNTVAEATREAFEVRDESANLEPAQLQPWTFSRTSLLPRIILEILRSPSALSYILPQEVQDGHGFDGCRWIRWTAG